MSEKIINCLVELGGNHWEKHGKNRVYFNAIELAKLLGYDWSNYKTGNISSSFKCGERISNSQMRRVLDDLNCKLYYDLDDGLFHYASSVGCDGEHVEQVIKLIRTMIGGN